MVHNLILEVVVLFLLPVLLVYLRIIPLKYIFPTILSVFILVLMITLSKNINPLNLGIRLDNLAISAIPYVLLTIFGSLLIYFLAKKLKKEPFKNCWKFYHFQFGFIFLALFQEFLYRSFLMHELKLMFSSFFLIVIIDAFLFSIMHVIFVDKKMAVSITFLAGLVFASVYYFYPNLLLITLSHAILNFVASYYNFFKIPRKDYLRRR